MISQYLTQLWWEHDHLYIRDTATSIVQLKYQNLPAVDLLLDVSPKAVAYLSVPPPQSLAQIAALHPNIGLSSAAKMAPQVHGFYAVYRGYQSSAQVPELQQIYDVSPKAVAYLSVPPPQSLAQIAALHPNIGLSSAAKMASQVHGFYAARPLNCRLQSNVAWINPFRRCQSYSIFNSDFYLVSGPNCRTISQYLAQLWWEHDPRYVRDTATSIFQLKSQNIPAVDLLSSM